MPMRTYVANFLLLSVLGIGACTFNKPETDAEQAERERRRADAESAARKAGRTAHEIARESEEAARKAGRELKNAAEQAREGWKDAERERPVNPKPAEPRKD